ncbi:MAG: hydrogenase nickel incorporation protein HypB [SAR324 cluster bacterium]|nr:hydrogenase nickel incorporation protein HypB [SAR324 cluster bacterium]
MCQDCGCIETAEPIIDGVKHHSHAQVHHHDHGHSESHSHGQEISIKQAILSKNNHSASHNREHFLRSGIFCCNWISAPGSGKTSLLESLIKSGFLKRPLTVIEGDQATDNDATRIREAGAKAVQINTGSACHLDADMIHKALHKLEPTNESIVMVENVGNMVCPTAFDLGENVKIAVVSTPEGADKPIKYPDLILTADCLVINKIDLMPYLNFDLERCLSDVKKLKPNLPVFPLSATTGEGLEEFANWIEKQAIETKLQKEVS